MEGTRKKRGNKQESGRRTDNFAKLGMDGREAVMEGCSLLYPWQNGSLGPGPFKSHQFGALKKEAMQCVNTFVPYLIHSPPAATGGFD